MIEIVRQDLLDILARAIVLVKEQNTASLKELSNHTIHDASIFQDEDSITIAVLIYALSKILERGKVDANSFVHKLDEASIALAKQNYKLYRRIISSIFRVISTIDKELHLYVEEVINQAKIRKSSRVYYHGISLARAASMLGVSQWELMNYIGKTSITEYSPGNVKSRLSFARKIFKEIN